MGVWERLGKRSVTLNEVKGTISSMAPFATLRLTVTLALALLAPRALLAQVGHPPGSSPYRDIPKGHTFTPFAAYFAGDGGRFGVAPHNGQVYGFRYDIRTGSTLQMGLLLGHGQMERLILDTLVGVAQPVTGTVDQSTTFVDANVQLNLTGGKTWNRLAPFIGAGIGLAWTEDPADGSGFELGTRFYFAPHAGLRLFVTDRIHLRGDARVMFWKLNYPNSSEWDTSGWYQAGLGFGFSL
jgi:Lipid A 3-O-deacylase (PagL)